MIVPAEQELHMPDSFEKLMELEAKIQADKKLNEAAIEELRKDVKALLEKLNEVIPLLEAAKNVSTITKAVEKTTLWIAKVSGSIAIIYAAYRFGLTELAEKVNVVRGGK